MPAKFFFEGLAGLACACALSGCADAIAPLPGAAAVNAPGIYGTPPSGIHAVKGECTGRIALTPGIPHRAAEGPFYPLIYDCSSKTFEVLRINSGNTLVALSDLTLTKDGYYLHQSEATSAGSRGGYVFYDRGGGQLRAPARPDDPRVHDLIVRDQDMTYLKYTPDRDAAHCGRGAPLELEIITEDPDGKVLWTWSSKGRFDISQKVASLESMGFQAQGIPGRWLRSIRHCYTAIARRAVKFDTPKWSIKAGGFPLLQLDQEDYIQVNSIQRVEPAGDILVSALLLDTVFLIDRKSGEVKWSLGGKFAKATPNRPAEDPRGGFSHQHFARIVGNTLWVLDNGNLFPDLPSRAVAYRLDSSPMANRLSFEFSEPNGRQRYALGSVQVLGDDYLLIGWGAVKPADRQAPQRAVSLVRLRDGKEVFSMDMAPGWVSYRAKAFQP